MVLFNYGKDDDKRAFCDTNVVFFLPCFVYVHRLNLLLSFYALLSGRIFV